MSVNDRLYDELLKPIVEEYYDLAKAMAEAGPESTHLRSYRLGRMHCLVEQGDRIASVLDVAPPLWGDMRALAGLES